MAVTMRLAGGDKLWGCVSLLFKLLSFVSLGGSNNPAITLIVPFGWSRKLQTWPQTAFQAAGGELG